MDGTDKLPSAAVAPPLVAVVDDDESVREALPSLVKELGFDVHAFPSAKEFLDSGRVAETRCLLLDVAMPGMSGPELQQELARRREHIPIVFITGDSDEGLRSRLMEQGAVGCLFKPFSEAELLATIHMALRSGAAGI